MSDQGEREGKLFPARVVAVITDERVVINRGSKDGLRSGQRFVIYGLSKDDIVDPDTGENLGKFEIVRGIGVVSHLQDRMATLTSALKKSAPKTIIRRNPMLAAFGTEEETVRETSETLPYEDVEKGDLARPA